MKYIIYTDGAYSKKHDEGAFAFIILNENEQEVRRYAQKIVNETNNRAELLAIMAGVYNVPDDATYVMVYSDSQYALNTLFGTWKREANKDLFEVWENRVLVARPRGILNHEWIRGHSGNEYNELCDQMCKDILGYDPSEEYAWFVEQKKKRKALPI